MTAFDIETAADRRLDEIYQYSAEHWGEAQAADYIADLFAQFEAIAARRVRWHSIPVDLGVTGYRLRHRRHYIYWRVTSAGSIAIMTVLHDRMEQGQHLTDSGA